MRMLKVLVPALLLCAVSARSQPSKKMARIRVLQSYSSERDYKVPGRLVCTQAYGCAARGAEMAAVYTIRVRAKLVGSGASISLVCVIRKKGDEKHCSSLKPGVYEAKPKGKDKLILYAWADPLYVGDMKKASKLEFRIGAGTP